MKKESKNMLAVAVTSLLLGGILGSASSAQAWWLRQTYQGKHGRVQLAPGSSRTIAGDVSVDLVKTSGTPYANARTINVEAFHLRADASNGVQICNRQYYGSGGVCSPYVWRNGYGPQSFQLSAYESVWDNEFDFPYLHMSTSSLNDTLAQTIHFSGIYVSN